MPDPTDPAANPPPSAKASAEEIRAGRLFADRLAAEMRATQHHVHQNLAPHSVTLTVNAKGFVQAEVKVYADTAQAAAEAALQTLKDVTEKLGDRAAK